MTVTLPELTDHVPGPACSLCGRPMDPDQEWCLECGAARTRIAAPPDWRIPVLIVAAVIVLVIGGLALAVDRLGADTAQRTVIETRTTSAPPTTALSGWAPGLDGYTVILAVAHSHGAAQAIGERAVADHIAGVGVLSTDAHPQMSPPGVLDVFAGRYPTYALAAAAAARLRGRGQPDARAAVVQRPGQG